MRAPLGSASRRETSRGEVSLREAVRPGTRRELVAALVEKPFESPPPPSRTPAAAGPLLEGRGRAGLILNRQPALVCLRPGADSCTVLGEALFQMVGPTSPPAPCAQPPAGSAFRRAGFPDQDSGRCTTTPQGSPPASTHRVVRKKRELAGVPSPAPSLSWGASYANLPPRPGVSPGMCPGRRAPSLHSSLCRPAPPLSAGGRVSEIIGGGSGACPGRAPASRPRLEGCKYTAHFSVLMQPLLSCPVQRGSLRWAWKEHVHPEATFNSGWALERGVEPSLGSCLQAPGTPGAEISLVHYREHSIPPTPHSRTGLSPNSPLPI